LSVLGGTAKADTTQGGAEALANATASLLSVGRKEIVVGHDFTVTGGSASTVGSNTKATALAGTDESKTGPDSAFTSTLFITTGGIMSVTGGEESAAGIAAAAILASAEIKLNAGGGLRLSGGSGSGLFQTLPGANKLLELEGRGFPITITGAISKITGLNLGDAFFLSGSPPLTLTDPALLRALDCVAISGGSCVLPASGSRAGDPSKLATGGTCK
jgi:hypothetical protein